MAKRAAAKKTTAAKTKSPASRKASPTKRMRGTEGGAAAAGAGAPSAFDALMAGAKRQRKATAAAVDPETPEDIEALTAGVSNELVAAVHPSWLKVLAPCWKKPSFEALTKFLDETRAKQTVFPPADQVYTAMRLTAFEDVKVVILGQDPYHGPNQANGMAFSVAQGVPVPPSLRNMYKEAHEDVGAAIPKHGDLTYWGKQGVLLLNTVLTVTKASANSHRRQGWEDFTTAIIRALNDRRSNLVFMLWGKPSQTKARFVNKTKHCVLEAPHPSPLSAHRGFMGCKHFSKANAYLEDKGLPTIDWEIK